MQSKAVLLSISILVSGQPDEVRRCLESLNDLREAVPCELLITDTGCPSETRKMVEKYADEIIPFTWCKDFSKARNVGLQRAKGKWFIYLDDDEWFENTKEIIDFFVSGEYQNYHYARYYQRNYSNMQGSKYSDAPVLRMIEKTADTTFVYSIHECLYPIKNPGKNFASYVHHYGYVYDDPQKKLDKAKRNIELLLNEYQRNPVDLHHVLQLVQEFGAIQDYEESLRYSYEGIDVWNKQHRSTGNMILYVNSLYTNVLQCLLQLGRYEEMLQIGEQFIEDKATDPLAKALIRGRMAVAAYELQDFKTCFVCAKAYWEAYIVLKKDADYYKCFETSLTRPCFERNMLQITIQCGIRAALAEQEYMQAKEFAAVVDWREGTAWVNRALIQDLIVMIGETDWQEASLLAEISNKLMERVELEEYFAESILEQTTPQWDRYALLQGAHPLFTYAKQCAVGSESDQGMYEKILVLKITVLRKRLENCPELAECREGLINSYIESVKELCDMRSEYMADAELDYQLALLLADVQKAMHAQDWKLGVTILKKISNLHAPFGILVKILLEDIRVCSKKQETQRQEFMALASAVKAQVRKLLEDGQKMQALQLLKQLSEMLPHDEEVIQLLKEYEN